MASKEALAIANCIEKDAMGGRKGQEAYTHFRNLMVFWQEQVDGVLDKEEVRDLHVFFSEMYPGVLPGKRK